MLRRTAALAAKASVKANELTTLGEALTEFGAVQSKPRQGWAPQAVATKELEDMFDDLDRTLDQQIDPLIEKFRTRNAAFYNEY